MGRMRKIEVTDLETDEGIIYIVDTVSLEEVIVKQYIYNNYGASQLHNKELFQEVKKKVVKKDEDTLCIGSLCASIIWKGVNN